MNRRTISSLVIGSVVTAGAIAGIRVGYIVGHGEGVKEGKEEVIIALDKHKYTGEHTERTVSEGLQEIGNLNYLKEVSDSIYYRHVWPRRFD